MSCRVYNIYRIRSPRQAVPLLCLLYLSPTALLSVHYALMKLVFTSSCLYLLLFCLCDFVFAIFFCYLDALTHCHAHQLKPSYLQCHLDVILE